MNRGNEIKNTSCDLCGSADADFILAAERLDGPLLRCRGCGLYFVELPPENDLLELNQAGKNHDVASLNPGNRTSAEMTRLADRARQLSLVEPDVETSEAPWRRITAEERVSDLKRFIDNGRLLEIGSSTGDFLASAGLTFKAEGVEADVNNLAVCLSRSLDCRGGTLSDEQYPADHFDVAVLYHVIEHFRSPSSELRELHRVIKPGGLLAIETPDISSFWFSLLGSRWRQIIPDHLVFFTPATLKILLDQTGFEILESRSVGKAMSVRLFISRLGRYHQSSARLIARLSEKLGISDLTLRLKLGDVIRVYARKKKGRKKDYETDEINETDEKD